MKKFLVITLLAMMVTASMAFFQPPTPKYENLKVLPKNTTKEEMDSIMKHFASSLGVKCNFCHVRMNDEKKDWNFASDENEHKGIARDMIKMTAKINKKHFKESGQVNTITCFTCHNGKEEPGRFAPPPPPRNGRPNNTK